MEKGRNSYPTLQVTFKTEDDFISAGVLQVTMKHHMITVIHVVSELSTFHRDVFWKLFGARTGFVNCSPTKMFLSVLFWYIIFFIKFHQYQYLASHLKSNFTKKTAHPLAQHLKLRLSKTLSSWLICSFLWCYCKSNNLTLKPFQKHIPDFWISFHQNIPVSGAVFCILIFPPLLH